MIPRFGKQMRPNQRYRHRPGAYAVLRRGNRILLTLQEVPKPEFQLPGGGIDPGESIMRALHREVMEETGWVFRLHRKLGVFRQFAYMPDYDLWAEKLCHIYLGQPYLRLGPPIEDNHIPVWMRQDMALEALANDGARHFLSSIH